MKKKKKKGKKKRKRKRKMCCRGNKKNVEKALFSIHGEEEKGDGPNATDYLLNSIA